MGRLLFLFFIGLCHVHLGFGQSDPLHESIHHYDLVKMINGIGSRLSASQDLMNPGNIKDIVSILSKYKNLIPTGNFSMDDMKGSGTDKCNQDIMFLFQNLQAKEMWGIKMLDALAKPGSGFLDGNFKWLGNYHECTGIYVPPKDNSTQGDFHGQYCTLDFNVDLSKRVIPLTVGICLPDSCNLAKIVNLTDGISFPPELESVLSNVNLTKHTCQPTSRKLTSAAIGMIFLLSIFVLLAVTGSSLTAYEYFSSRSTKMDFHSGLGDTKSLQMNGSLESDTQATSSNIDLISNKNETNVWYSEYKSFFNCFCVFTNGEKLLNTNSTEGQLLCLHGIRFLSMSWVIVCHTYAFCFASIGNLLETMSIIDSWLFQIILNGFYSVDSFFLLSGFLVAHLFFQESEKTNGKVPWLYFYVHRYVRLTPVYMIVLGIYTTLYYYMGSGPFWTTSAIDPICKDNWWWNLLYINNFNSPVKLCIGWSWYLANDMQFFVICPMFLITLWRWPRIGYALIGLFLSASFAANVGITYHYDLFSGLGNISSTNLDMKTFMEKFALFFEKLYTRPYTRISPYLIGIVLAYIVFKRKQNNQGKLNRIVFCCGWIVASGITLACLFGLYNRTMTVVENCFYNAMNRTCFAIGVGWLIFTCLNGQGGPVNSILSFKIFLPLSRLTYCAYLVHPIFLTGYFAALKTPLQFSHMTMVTIFLGQLVISYLCAFLVSVLFESPIIRLEKLVRTKFRS